MNSSLPASGAGTDGKLPIHSVEVGEPIPLPDNRGDTWDLAWAADGTLYSPSNDTRGFHQAGSGNVMFHRITGDHPAALTGETVNTFPDYGRENELGPDKCSWKSSGCLALDGMLYLLVARHAYGETSGDPHRRQTAANASFIVSADGGRTWRRSARENMDQPMFPGRRFAAPYFVHYGQDGAEAVADGSDRFVYALSNNGFWDNGDDLVLGRVLRSRMPRLDAADWQFLAGQDGSKASAWTSSLGEARPVLSRPGRIGSTGAAYLPARRCYFMITWYYPAGGGKMPDASVETVWDFNVAPRPWGPWTRVGSHTFKPEGYYGPQVCAKFTSREGAGLVAFTAGNWNDEAVYRLTAVPLTLGWL